MKKIIISMFFCLQLSSYGAEAQAKRPAITNETQQDYVDELKDILAYYRLELSHPANYTNHTNFIQNLFKKNFDPSVMSELDRKIITRDLFSRLYSMYTLQPLQFDGYLTHYFYPIIDFLNQYNMLLLYDDNTQESPLYYINQIDKEQKNKLKISNKKSIRNLKLAYELETNNTNGIIELLRTDIHINIQQAELILKNAIQYVSFTLAQVLFSKLASQKLRFSQDVLNSTLVMACSTEETRDQDQYNIVTFLIDYGANVNYRDPQTNISPLKAAINKKIVSLPLVKLLLEKKAIVGCTAWDKAISESNIELFNLLLNAAGSNIEIQDAYGNTPLHYAAQYNNPKMALELIRKGAKINTKNKNEETPFLVLCDLPIKQKKLLELIDIFLNHGANVNEQNADRNTLAYIIIATEGYQKNKEIIDHLKEKGADLLITNTEGKSAQNLIKEEEEEDNRSQD